VNLEHVQEIANAVLYEGYMLYPYRPSSVKNRQRFNFGVLCPPAYSAVQPGSGSSFLQTECLFRAPLSAQLAIHIRFLQIVQRSIGQYRTPQADELDDVDRLVVDGHVHQPWQEAVEQSITYDALAASELLAARRMDFTVPALSSREELSEPGGRRGAIVRASRPLAGSLHVGAERFPDNIIKLRLRLENCTGFDPSREELGRDAALPYSLVSAHMILGIENGEFISLLEPPDAYADLVRGCENIGNWPVLAGNDATTMLASPIILYDYPKIAPESAGNLFDSTEIDEILSLRILTLTDREKEEIRQMDDRARALLERTESIPDEQFMKLHGVLRGVTALKEGPA
jgi:hypothetical protein